MHTCCRLVTLAPRDHMIVASPCNGLVVLGTIDPRPPLALGEGHATIPTLLTLLNRTLPVKNTSTQLSNY